MQGCGTAIATIFVIICALVVCVLAFLWIGLWWPLLSGIFTAIFGGAGVPVLVIVLIIFILLALVGWLFGS